MIDFHTRADAVVLYEGSAETGDYREITTIPIEGDDVEIAERCALAFIAGANYAMRVSA